MTKTSIEWCRGDDGAEGKTWNPVRGCARVSPGCKHCYAERFAARFAGDGMPYNGLVKLGSRVVKREFANGDVELKKVALEPRWTGAARFVPEMLDQPLRWKKPRRIFVNSMSDLFHEDITDQQIAAVFGVMAACPQHTFQILTKRAERMRTWFKWHDASTRERGNPWIALMREAYGYLSDAFVERIQKLGPWPLPNVWLGVSVEDQRRADERIPMLLDTPAAVRFISAEPLLELTRLERFVWPVHSSWPSQFKSREDAIAAGATVTRRRQALVSAHLKFLDLVIVGGESGSGSRPFHLEWARSIVTQCREAGAHVFVKQMGDAPFLDGKPLKLSRKGKDMVEWPEDLRVREMP